MPAEGRLVESLGGKLLFCFTVRRSASQDAADIHEPQ